MPCGMNLQPTRRPDAFTLVEIMVVIVVIGLLAALALPQFQKVRTSAQDRAVTNNLRALAGAADQYYLENGVTTVALTNLVGSTNYVKNLSTVASEVYPTDFTQGVTLTVTNVAGARVLTFSP